MLLELFTIIMHNAECKIVKEKKENNQICIFMSERFILFVHFH